jgi:hypothetical protein
MSNATADTGRASQGARSRRLLRPIRKGEVYQLEDAKGRLGWSDSAFRAAKRRGLRLLACGKRRYLTGDEAIRFLESIQQT